MSDLYAKVLIMVMAGLFVWSGNAFNYTVCPSADELQSDKGKWVLQLFQGESPPREFLRRSTSKWLLLFFRYEDMTSYATHTSLVYVS